MQNEMARDSYSYIHLVMVAGIVLVALGLKTTIGHFDDHLDAVPAFALLGGVAIYLLGHVAFRYRHVHTINRQRLGAGDRAADPGPGGDRDAGAARPRRRQRPDLGDDRLRDAAVRRGPPAGAPAGGGPGLSVRPTRLCATPPAQGRTKVAGSGPIRSPLSSGRSRMSSSLSSKSKTSMFSRIRSGVTDLGMTTLPSCRCQRRIAWAGRLAVALGDRDDRLVVEQRALGERAPGLGDDAVLRVPGAQLGLLEARVQLDLVDGRQRAGLAPRAVRGPRCGSWRRRSCAPPLLVDALEGAPGIDEEVLARHRPVDQVEVDVVEAEPAEALPRRRARVES